MESIEKKQLVEVTLRKIFDMKMKGHEMRKAMVDEVEFLRSFYFLKGNRVYLIDISTKKIEELEFTRGKEVAFITGNLNNEYLIVVLKNGNIYAIDNNHNVKHIKNLIVNLVLFDGKKSGKEKESQQSGVNFDNFKMFASSNLDKLVIANENFMTIWYRSEPIGNSSGLLSVNKNIIKKSTIEELTGTFYNISLENEKKILLTPEAISKKNHYETISANFGNSYLLGSFGRILYLLLMPTDIPNLFKLTMVDYLFKYDSMNRYRSYLNSTNNSHSVNVSPYTQSYEYVKNIEKRTIYTYLQYSTELSKENLPLAANKERLIIKFNSSSNSCAIVVNSQHPLSSYLQIYMTETSRFTVFKLYDLFSKVKPPKNEEGKNFLWVEDIDWICNDLFLVILFSQGYFVIVNMNFQLINFIDTSGSLLNTGNSIEQISCPAYIHSQKVKLADRFQLISSKKRTDYFIIYSNNYSVCFQANYKSYESRILMANTVSETFDDFLYTLKYFQIYHNEAESSGLFDKIHNYMVKCLKDLYHPETESNTMPNENVSHIFSTFVKFIRIFRSINQIHETNLTILSYLIGVSNDFFYHLINYKEIWLAFLFIDICENYLLKHLRLKVSRNKLCDEQLSKGQVSYMVFNPYFLQNPSLKCFNKIANKVLHSRMRLILIFFALIEFRNNQALNINVLYFVLAKLCIDKLKKHNLLDDVQLIVKVIIRNWKYLKNENSRAGGEEFILNGLTMNYRTEILSQFIQSRTPRDDVKFDFFTEFLPLDSLQDFTELHEAYCRGEEESLINEYNYIYNIGIVQRWILFFTNYFYNLMFEDIKNYISSHVKQTITQKKEAENISPEEMNLSSLVYFNFTIYLLTLNNHLRFFLKFFSAKSENSNELSFITEDPRILSDFNKLFLPFLSPTDVPFAIFEFYSLEDNKNKKNLPYEICTNLNNLLISYSKSYNFSMIDTLDFVEFLIENGFKSYWEAENCSANTENNNAENNRFKIGKLQKLMFSGFSFFIFSIHKLNQLHFFEQDNDLILSTIDNMQINLKTEFYEFIFLILNGHLRYFLSKEQKGELNPNNTKYLEVVLNFIKVIFYRIVREDTFYVRKNIHEFVYITPSVMKAYLIEGALFYEYKNFNRYVREKLLNSNNLLDINNFLCSSKKAGNIFEELTKEMKSNQMFEVLFKSKTGNESEFLMFQENFVMGMRNLILLTKLYTPNTEKSSSTPLVFSFESNIDYIRKLILNGISEKVKENYDERLTYELVLSIIDKIVKGNFENKSVFKFSSAELKQRLVKSIKLAVFKLMYLFNILYVKYKCFYSLNPHKDIIAYLKHISFCILNGREETNKEDVLSSVHILDYLLQMNMKDLKENDKVQILEIIQNLSILFFKIKKNLLSFPRMISLEDKIRNENKDLSSRLKVLLHEDSARLKAVYENLVTLKSNNLKLSLILMFSDTYWENLVNTYNQFEAYAVNQNTKLPLRNARKRYTEMSESFFNLTGIPSKNFIQFTDNWQLINDEELYHLIVNDDQTDLTPPDEKLGNNLMNRRQKYGCDTPKRKPAVPVFFPNKDVLVNTYVSEDPTTTLNTSYSKDTNRSVDLHEETQPVKVSTAIKLKSKKAKANLPKYGETPKKQPISDLRLEDDKSVVTIIKSKPGEMKIEDQDDVSVNTVLRPKKDRADEIGDYDPDEDSHKSKISSLLE